MSILARSLSSLSRRTLTLARSLPEIVTIDHASVPVTTCCVQHRTMMAGHNKWSKIRHKKGANDVKKALILGKASKSLRIVAKECQGDRSDMRLQAAIQHAKSVQLPRDRIDEAIESAATKSGGSHDFFPLRFDAMMRLEDNVRNDENAVSSSVQVACIITALSDNRNRTTQHVRHLVTKYGGEFLPTDHLNYLFEHVGRIVVQTHRTTTEDDLLVLEEDIIESALEAGAINVEPTDDDDDDDESVDGKESIDGNFTRFVVTTEEKDLWKVVRSLQSGAAAEDDNNNPPSAKKWDLVRFEHKYILKEDYGEVASIHTDSPAQESLGDFLDQLEENEDVHKVYHNAVLV